MVLKEELLGKLIYALRHQLHREPSSYHFIMEQKNHTLDDFSYLERYLRSETIAFQAIGISLRSQCLLPVSMVADTDYGKFPMGLYIIYPETDREVIFYFYLFVRDLMRDVPHYIVCCRDLAALTSFLNAYRSFCTSLERAKRTIYVHGARDIPLPDLCWDDIILPQSLKEDIRRDIDNFIRNESTYKRLKIPYKRGLLFTGPPGNGKTLLMKVISSSYPDRKFLYFGARHDSDNGDLDLFFEKAAELAPSMLGFEDIDSLFKGQITLSHFLNKLDGFEERNGTLILATTNHPEDIDPALTSRPSRFDRAWIIDNPDQKSRMSYIEQHLTGLCVNGLQETVARATEGFSMAYLKELYVTASMIAIERNLAFPGEEEVMESLKVLSSQISAAKRQFVGEVKTLGFAVR